MPEPVNKTNADAVVNEPTSRASAFSPEYVKELREEAAGWRTKFRETETKLQDLEENLNVAVVVSKVKEEISKRGLKINPDFITLGEDGDPVKAVDTFLEEYPQFAVEPTTKHTQEVNRAKPSTSHKTNTNVNKAQFGNIQDIKKDPIARAKLRDQYRSMLGRGDN